MQIEIIVNPADLQNKSVLVLLNTMKSILIVMQLFMYDELVNNHY